ncbi:MAG: cardiolipin synthase [Planctomycetes bacterium]|nr:cardiolipin synthase [Planctomycetota bacterium]
MLESILSLIGAGLHVAAIFVLVMAERREPTATLSWLLALIFLPIVGLVLYLVIGRQRARRVADAYVEAVERVDEVVSRERLEVFQPRSVATEAPREVTILAELGSRLSSTPPTSGNDTRMLVDAAAAYPAIEVAIGGARHHVHVEFFIVRDDDTGRRLRDLLVATARRGVAVRFLCDAVGSRDLPRDFFDPLRAAGGEAAFFRPVGKILARIYLRDRVDFRNHRKIVVVDGQVGYTGGINVGREYLGLDPSRGHWRDSHVEIRGPAVLAMQKAFAEDWLAATGELLTDPDHYPEPLLAGAEAEVVQIVDSGPDRSHSPISYLFVQAFALAYRRIWLTSPYFIPSPPIEQALLSAALRGVDVRLLVPRRPDHRITAWAGASYFRALLEAGVRIHRYEDGFIHAKVWLVDDWVASIGSANMDIRSFDLNYELNAIVYGPRFNGAVADQFLLDLESAEEWRLADEDALGPAPRLLRAAARLASPIL